VSRSRVLADHWVTMLAGRDRASRRFVRRAYSAYRRRIEQDDASPWTDVGGEG